VVLVVVAERAPIKLLPTPSVVVIAADQKRFPQINQLRFISFASGSNGNAYYVGTLLQGVLLDAGVSPRALRRGLSEVGIPLEALLGVCITHDHIDHILYAGAYSEKLCLPVFATEKVHDGIMGHPSIKNKPGASRRTIQKGAPFALGPFTITAFDTPHDGSDNAGFAIEYEGKILVIATDLGHISQSVATQITRANYLVLEANYDEQMLETGRYPRYLKERIRHDHGHLCNRVAAQFVAEHYPPHLSHLFLCHLSQENNHPDVALQTVSEALADKGIRIGIDLQVQCLPRRHPSECFLL
jgi:phosphoribosyl 1,2-cyclic phosphodiesterase